MYEYLGWIKFRPIAFSWPGLTDNFQFRWVVEGVKRGRISTHFAAVPANGRDLRRI